MICQKGAQTLFTTAVISWYFRNHLTGFESRRRREICANFELMREYTEGGGGRTRERKRNGTRLKNELKSSHIHTLFASLSGTVWTIVVFKSSVWSKHVAAARIQRFTFDIHVAIITAPCAMWKGPQNWLVTHNQIECEFIHLPFKIEKLFDERSIKRNLFVSE